MEQREIRAALGPSDTLQPFRQLASYIPKLCCAHACKLDVHVDLAAFLSGVDDRDEIASLIIQGE